VGDFAENFRGVDLDFRSGVVWTVWQFNERRWFLIVPSVLVLFVYLFLNGHNAYPFGFMVRVCCYL